MSRMNLKLPSHEGALLWRFFDSVSSAVSKRMQRGSVPGEENLTFLLCELLDEGATGLHVMDYSLAQLKEELEKSDAGISVDVGFETHEHKKYFESRYSGADLGIVLSIDHPIIGKSRRAMLVQAKKLFAGSQSKEFSLWSSYSSFDKDQAAFLRELSGRFGVGNSIYYLWYNPPSSAFSEKEAKHVRAYEAQGTLFNTYWGHFHPFLDELIEMGFPFVFGSRNGLDDANDEEEERKHQWRARQPALRISALDAVLSLTGDGSVPHLKSFYDALRAPSDRISFSPFADFFLLAIANSRYGSSDEQWIQLAEGKKLAMPPRRQTSNNEPASPLDKLQQVPIPRHTIRVAIKSTLPQVG